MTYRTPPTKNPGDALSAQDWNRYIRDNFQALSGSTENGAYCRVSCAISGVVEKNQTLPCPWQNPVGATEMFDAAQPTRLTALTPGLFKVSTKYSLVGTPDNSLNWGASMTLYHYSSSGVLKDYCNYQYTDASSTSTSGQFIFAISAYFSAAQGDYFTSGGKMSRYSLLRIYPSPVYYFTINPASTTGGMWFDARYVSDAPV